MVEMCRNEDNKVKQRQLNWLQACCAFHLSPIEHSSGEKIADFVEAGWVKRKLLPKKKVEELQKKGWCEGACYTYEVSSKTLTNAASRQEQLNMWQEIEKGAADEMKIQELQGLMEGVKKEGCWGSEERAKAHKRQEECSGGGEGSALN